MAIATGNLDFALKLTQRCYKSGKNLSLSPYSVRIAFSMALNGAQGETLRQMAKVLGYTRDDYNSINSENEQTLRQLLEKAPADMFSSVNGLWLSVRDKLNPDYVKRVGSVYRSEVAQADFTQRQAINLVNKWVSQKTDGRTTKLFDQLDPRTVMVIANIISFTGVWETPFDSRYTKPQPWTMPNGSKTQVQMMHQNSFFFYQINDDYTALKIDYKAKNWSMILVMPAKMPIDKFMKSINSADINKMLTSFKGDGFELFLPRFDITSPCNLVPVMRDMGMTRPFTRGADFRGMTVGNTGELLIGQAVHNCAVAVNETGTKASAATGLTMFKGKPSEIRFDKPFMFLIRHELTGEVVFSGVVCEPELAKG